MSLTARSVVKRGQTLPPPRSADVLSSVPVARRSSLPKDQRQGRGNQLIIADDLEGGLPRADNLQEERVTNPPRPSTIARTPRTTCSGVRPESMHVGKMKIVLYVILVAFFCWSAVTGFLAVRSWWNDMSNTYAYGPTRTSVVSGVFGINHDSQVHKTSVIAINLNGTLVLESVPAGDVTGIKIYPTGFTMVGDTVGKLPVHLTIVHLTVNRVKDTRPDVQVDIPGQNITLDLINTGTGFVLTTPK